MKEQAVSISRDASVASGEFRKEKNYWLHKLSGELIKSYFPYDYNKPENTGNAGNEGNADSLTAKKNAVTIAFSGEVISRLTKLSGGSDYSLHMIAVAAAVVLLDKYAYGESQDIVVGTPIYKPKKNPGTEFVNTVLALRVQTRENMTFKELLLQVRETILEADKHKNYPLEVLVPLLNMSMSGHDFPLFDAAVLVENIHDSGYLRRTPVNVIFCFRRESDRVELEIRYNGARYRQTTVERIASYFASLLGQVLADWDVRLRDIWPGSEEDRRRVLFDFNDTAVEYPKDRTIHELFEEQVDKTPDSVAVVGGAHQLHEGAGSPPLLKNKKNENVSITYKKLNEKSGRLAHLLKKKGVQPDTIVGIMMERSIEMIVGILGILKAGGAYLPLDPGHPEARIKYMLRDTCASVLVTRAKYKSRYENEIEIIEAGLHISSTGDTGNPAARLRGKADNLAYIIYTSGTTGKPRGTLTAHFNVIRVVRNSNYIDVRKNDRVLQLSNYAFDGSVFDIYGALLNGAALVLPERGGGVVVDPLSNMIEREAITVFFVTTALFNALMELKPECLAHIRKILFGGERVSVEHCKKALAELGPGKIVHVYGPTETTVFATYYFVDGIGKSAGTVPIGGPIANTVVYILDRSLNPVPIGIQGEIYIGGDGLARGYLNNPELTAKKFTKAHELHELHELTRIKKKGADKEVIIDRKFHLTRNTKHLTLYRTCDLARWLEDGSIEFLGRIDHQVKIRGFRIELGEIENRLLEKEEIKEAVVLAREDQPGEKYLCAYIVTGREQDFNVTELREYLSKDLPDYMIPSYVVRLAKMPLTANGKVDRRALPVPEIGETPQNRTAPENPSQQKLLGIWSEVLNVNPEKLGIDTNFFRAGGHSLKATLLTANIHKEFDVKIPLAEIFTHPTIRELARFIEASGRDRFLSIEPAERKDYYPLSSAQKRIYILQGIDGNRTVYNVPEFMILEGEIGKEQFEETFKKMIRRHGSLRTYFTMIGQEPVQRIQDEDEVKFEIEYKTASLEGTGKKETVPVRELTAAFIRPFDLSRAPLIRVGLVKADEREYILMVDMHHIVSDGTSLGVFMEDFTALYSGRQLSQLRLQYKDFAEWQTRMPDKEDTGNSLRQQERYWLKQFAGGVPRLTIPTDFPRSSSRSFAGDVVGFDIDPDSSTEIRKLVMETGTTMFVLLLAVFTILLSKYSRDEDIVVGTAVAGRRHADLANIIGMFVNTLPLRNYPEAEKPFDVFLQEVKTNAIEAFENQDYQFEALVEKLEIERDPARNPIFDVELIVQNLEMVEMELHIPGIGLKPYPVTENQQSKFDLSIEIMEGQEEIFVSLAYCTKLFERATAEKMIRHFLEVLEQVLENRRMKLKDIRISHDLSAAAAVIDEESTLYDF